MHLMTLIIAAAKNRLVVGLLKAEVALGRSACRHHARKNAAILLNALARLEALKPMPVPAFRVMPRSTARARGPKAAIRRQVRRRAHPLA